MTDVFEARLEAARTASNLYREEVERLRDINAELLGALEDMCVEAEIKGLRKEDVHMQAALAAIAKARGQS